MLDNRTVGKTIAALRQANGMTQQKLAATMNVSHQAVSKWETGQALPDMQTMLDLSRMFGVTMEQLLLGDIPESRLHPREAQEEEAAEKAAPGFDLRSAMQDVVNGIGSLFKAPAGTAKPEAPKDNIQEEAAAQDVPAQEEETAEAEAPDEGEDPAAEETAKDEPEQEAAEEHVKDEDLPPIDIEKIIEMAPFMSRVALEDMLMQYRGRFTARDVARLAPFVTSETLEALIWRVDGSLDWDLLRRIAPFLQRDVVDRLTYAYVQGEKAVRPAMDTVGRAAENLGRNIQKKVSEVDFDKLGEQISSGVNHVVREAQKFGESVAREMNRAFCPPQEKPAAPEKKQASEHVQAARRHMFERAMDEDKWDWIAERLPNLDDDALKADITRRAVELGKLDWVEENCGDVVTAETVRKAVETRDWEWLSDHMERIDTDLHTEIAMAAAEDKAWDFLTDNVSFMDLGDCSLALALAALDADAEDLLSALAEEYLSEEENLQIAEKALAAGKYELLEALTEHMDAGAIDQVCLRLAEAQKWEALDGVMEHADEAIVDSICLKLAAGGEWGRVEEHLDEVSEDALAQLMELAVEAGNWEIIESLEAYMD